MRAQLKQLSSDTAIYGLSTMVGRFVNYLLVPLYIAMLTRAENGVIGVVYAAFVLLNVLYTYGLESSYLKFAAGDEGRARTTAAFSTAFWSLLVSSLAFSAFLLACRSWVAGLIKLPPQYHHLLWYMAAILIFDSLSTAPMAELRLARRAWTFAALRLLNVGVNVALNVALIVGLQWRVEAVLLSNAAASAVLLLLSAYATRAHLRVTFDGALFRAMLRFGLPYVPTGIGYAITESMDRIFLSHLPEATTQRLYGSEMSTQGMVGVYSNCYKFAVFMLLFVQMFRFAWQPFFLHIQNDPAAPKIFARSFTLFTAIGALVFLLISSYADPLARIIARGNYANYAPGLFIVPIILLAYLGQGWYTHFTAGIFIRSRTRDLPWIMLIGAVITVAVNFLLIPVYGMAASAWATLASYWAMALALGRVSQRLYPVPYEWGRLAWGAGIVAAAYGIQCSVPLTAYAVRAGILALVVALFIATGMLPNPRQLRLSRK